MAFRHLGQGLLSSAIVNLLPGGRFVRENMK